MQLASTRQVGADPARQVFSVQNFVHGIAGLKRLGLVDLATPDFPLSLKFRDEESALSRGHVDGADRAVQRVRHVHRRAVDDDEEGEAVGSSEGMTGSDIDQVIALQQKEATEEVDAETQKEAAEIEITDEDEAEDEDEDGDVDEDEGEDESEDTEDTSAEDPMEE